MSMTDPNYVVEFTDGSKMTADTAAKDEGVYKIVLGKETVSVETGKVEAFHEVSHTEWEPTGVGEIHTEEGEAYDVPFEKEGIAGRFLR
jgi:hypothetical protein